MIILFFYSLRPSYILLISCTHYYYISYSQVIRTTPHAYELNSWHKFGKNKIDGLVLFMVNQIFLCTHISCLISVVSFTSIYFAHCI